VKRSVLEERGADAQQNKCRRQTGAAGCHGCVWECRMQQGHLIGERRECAHSGDAEDGVAEAHSSALPRLVVEVGGEAGPILDSHAGSRHTN